MVRKFLLNVNPLILSAVIISFLFYSGFLLPSSKNTEFCSLLALSDIEIVEGLVVGSPIKSEKGNKYFVNLLPFYVVSDNGFSSSCCGKISVLVDAFAIESYFPDKLYTKGTEVGPVLCDNGAKLRIFGNFISDDYLFSANKINQLDWDSNLTGKLNYYRALTRLEFRRLMYAFGDAGGLLLALITGMKEYINPVLFENFKKAGLSHILALSGMHLSLFMGISSLLFNKIFGKKLTNFINIFVIFFFVWFAGRSPSLTRALICSLLTIIVSSIGMKSISFATILSLSFLIHCSIFPNDIMNIGFILSYGALAGIVLCSKFINQYLSFLFPTSISSPFASSISAQVFTIPVSIHFFKCVPIIGIVSTVFISPFINYFIYIGIFFIILCFSFPIFVPVAEFILKILYNSINYFIYIFSCTPLIEV